MTLRPRQLRFVEEYLVDLDGKHAAIRAGYAAGDAKNRAYRLLQRPAIVHALGAAMEAREERTGITRERPSFLYVCYCMILASIPMGVLYAVDVTTAQRIAQGLQAWLAAIPDALWQLFMVGYLGYTGGRSWEKIKGVSR